MFVYRHQRVQQECVPSSPAVPQHRGRLPVFRQLPSWHENGREWGLRGYDAIYTSPIFYFECCCTQVQVCGVRMLILPLQYALCLPTLWFTDVDECQDGSHLCRYSQMCQNTIGGYGCVCPRGYQSQGVGRPCLGKTLHFGIDMYCFTKQYATVQ